jgi:hypothetical protein
MDWDRGGLPNEAWEALLAEMRRRADAAGHKSRFSTSRVRRADVGNDGAPDLSEDRSHIVTLALPARASPPTRDSAHRQPPGVRRSTPRQHPGTVMFASVTAQIAGSGALGPGALGVVLCGSGAAPDGHQKPLSRRSRQVSRHSPELSSVCCIDSVVSAAVPRRPTWAFRVRVMQRGPATATK